MSRLARYASFIASVSSLLICVAACLMWGRSYDVGDMVYHVTRHKVPTYTDMINGQVITEKKLSIERTWTFGSSLGQLMVGVFQQTDRPFSSEPPGLSREIDEEISPLGIGLEPTLIHNLGFDFLSYHKPLAPGRVNFMYSVLVPYWSIAVIATIWPGLRLLVWRRLRSRQRSGLCLACGYDLRYSKERCPECGTATHPERQMRHKLRSALKRQSKQIGRINDS